MPKFERIAHCPWSENWSGDDLRLIDTNHLLNKPLIQLEKMDGSNHAISKEFHHARSVDSKSNPWDTYVASIHGQIRHLLNPNEIIYGENMFAIHSILYEKLDNYFYVFNIVQDDIFISWNDTEQRCKELGLKTVPVINHYKPFQSTKDLQTQLEHYKPTHSYYGSTIEGYVVRNSNSFNRSEFNLNVAKNVRANHVKNFTTKHWTKNWKKADLI
jgi:hypothetical protein